MVLYQIEIEVDRVKEPSNVKSGAREEKIDGRLRGDEGSYVKI